MYIAKVTQNPKNKMEFSLLIECDSVSPDAVVRVQLNDSEKFFMPRYSAHMLLPVETAGENAVRTSFSLLNIVNTCGATNENSRELEFAIVSGADDEKLMVDEKFAPITVKSPLLNYRIGKGSGGNLILRMLWNPLSLTASAAAEADGWQIDLPDAPAGELLLRRRIANDIAYPIRQTACEMRQPGSFFLPVSELTAQAGEGEAAFDLIYRVPAGEDRPGYGYGVTYDGEELQLLKDRYTLLLRSDENGAADIAVSYEMPVLTVELNEVLNSAPKLPPEKHRVVRVARRVGLLPQRKAPEFTPETAPESEHAQLTFYYGDEKELRFSGDALEGVTYRLQRVMRMENMDDTDGRVFYSDEAPEFAGNVFSVRSWSKLRLRNTLSYRLLAEVDGVRHLVLAEEAGYQRTVNFGHQTLMVKSNPDGIYIHVTEREKKIPIGILGTCMTRWAFSRKYTDAYRSLFEVKYSHFWPSVFSMTEEPIEFPENMYSEYDARELPLVRREYDKTFMQELKDAKCEYVLIDFFVDAIHGPRRMPDGKFISYKAYARDFYQDFLMFDSQKYHMSTNDYLENWKQKADVLIEQLREVIPENRIVLATGGLTHYFIDESGNRVCFDGMTLRSSSMTKDSIDALNYLWDQMNTYFMAKLPGARILSMRDYHFQAFDPVSANVRPYHYVNAYYRAMSAELSRIVLWDRINR